MNAYLAAATPLGDRPIEFSYAPGACNIGPAEIARRRRTGHLGLVVTVGLFALLLAIEAPPLARLFVALPAAAAAAGYLQARLRFCAAFGVLGVFNFEALGRPRSVADRAAARKDRRRAIEIGAAALAIGLAVGGLAVLLPL